jgi:hypothetical protein
MPERVCHQHSWPFGRILNHDCGVRGVVRLPNARREDVPICRSPPCSAFPWRVWAPSANERRPESLQENWLRRKDVNPFWNQYLTCNQRRLRFRLWCLRNSRRLRDAGDLPVPTTSQPRRDQVEKMPDGVKRPSARQLSISTNSCSEPKRAGNASFCTFARSDSPPPDSHRR